MDSQPMAFRHSNGLVPTWRLAQKYIAEGGRLATLPDIIDARLSTEPGSAPWEMFFTTLTAEYVGPLVAPNRLVPTYAALSVAAHQMHELGLI